MKSKRNEKRTSKRKIEETKRLITNKTYADRFQAVRYHKNLSSTTLAQNSL